MEGADEVLLEGEDEVLNGEDGAFPEDDGFGQ
jgi:hypothetical protein